MWIWLSEITPRWGCSDAGYENYLQFHPLKALNFLAIPWSIQDCCKLLIKHCLGKLFPLWPLLSRLLVLQKWYTLLLTWKKCRRWETIKMALPNIGCLPHSSKIVRNWFRIIEFLRLENTFKIAESNHNLYHTTPTLTTLH